MFQYDKDFDKDSILPLASMDHAIQEFAAVRIKIKVFVTSRKKASVKLLHLMEKTSFIEILRSKSNQTLKQIQTDDLDLEISKIFRCI